MIPIAKLITKFGSAKVVTGAFLVGLSLSAPIAYGVHKLWLGAVDRAEKKALKETIDDQRMSIKLERHAKDLAEKTAEIAEARAELLSSENTRLTNLNIGLAESRAGTVERIYVQGEKQKQAASDRGDQCATSLIDAKLREWGNGSDFDPAKMPRIPEAN